MSDTVHTRPPRRRGTVAIVVAVAMMAMFGLMAFSIDVAYTHAVDAELQGVADAVALAAASGLDDGPAFVKDRANLFAAANTVGGKSVKLDPKDIVFGTWDAPSQTFTPVATEADGTAVRVTVRNTTGLFFAPMFGVSTSSRAASATAAFSGGSGSSWDIMIVQDITGSFSGELPDAVKADRALLKCVKDSTVGSQFGLVVFGGVGATHISPGSIDTSTDFSNVDAKVAAVKDCGKTGMPACGGTNIGAGLSLGIDVLQASTSNLPPAIVLVSDGEPACNKSCPSGMDTAQLRQYAKDQAARAAAANITIYSLYYGKLSDTTAIDFMASLTTLKGTSHVDTVPADMEKTLQAICRSQFKLRVVE